MGKAVSVFLEEKFGTPVPVVFDAHSIGKLKADATFSGDRKEIRETGGTREDLREKFRKHVHDFNLRTRIVLEKMIIGHHMDGVITIKGEQDAVMTDCYGFPADGLIEKIPGGYDPEKFHFIPYTEEQANAVLDDIAAMPF